MNQLSRKIVQQFMDIGFGAFLKKPCSEPALIKTIEALSYRKPLVASTAGIAGLEDLRGKAFLVADTDLEFVEALLRERIQGNGNAKWSLLTDRATNANPGLG